MQVELNRPSVSTFAEQAYHCQTACNAAGVVNSFHEWTRHAIVELEHGTDTVNQHPITRAFIDKLCQLARMPIALPPAEPLNREGPRPYDDVDNLRLVVHLMEGKDVTIEVDH